MTLSRRQLNRATLARQLLLTREPTTVVDAVRRVVAIQAQEPASPYLALWNRVAGFDAADLDVAFATQAVVKAQLLRLTLHAVAADDYPTFQHAMVPLLRASRLNDSRFQLTGLSADEVDAVVPGLLGFTAEPRTTAEVEAWLADRFGRPVPRAWWALKQFAPVVHAATRSSGAWAHGPRPSYVVATTPPHVGDAAEAVQVLVRRCLEGFGPASGRDLARLTFLRAPVVADALAAMASTLITFEGPNGAVLHDAPNAPIPDEGTPAPPRLLGMWDSCLLAYADHDRIIPPEHRSVVIRRNGDVLPSLLVDGNVAGVWRPVDGGIEATVFHPLSKRAWAGLAAEARSLISFLAGRDPNVYRRYAHWWEKLPAAERRVLRG
jgi:hypothetical protein